jgi:hypothetical protein
VIPGLSVSVDGSVPVTIRPTTNALWLAEETLGNLATAATGSQWALLLTLAYYGVVGEPDTAAELADVRAWARDHSVRVEEVEDNRPDPTRARSTGPSSDSP